MAKKVTVKKHGYFYNTVEEATVKKRGSFSEKVVEAGGGGGTEELLLRPGRAGGNFKIWRATMMTICVRKFGKQANDTHNALNKTILRLFVDCKIDAQPLAEGFNR